MGFSLTGTHVIYFIASVIIASAVSGVLMAVSNDLSISITGTGERIRDKLDTEFKIINDPNNIPNVSGNFQFYRKTNRIILDQEHQKTRQMTYCNRLLLPSVSSQKIVATLLTIKYLTVPVICHNQQ